MRAVYANRWLLLCACILLGFGSALGAEPRPVWHTDYGVAFDQAEREQKMLLVFFREPESNPRDNNFEKDVLGHPCIATRLCRMVCVRLATDVEIQSGGQSVRLLEHAAFSDLAGQAGVAIVDLVSRTSPQHGEVVSALPFATDHALSGRQLSVLLDLPRGTFAERSVAYPAALREAPRGGLQRFIDRTRAVVRARRRTAENQFGWYADYQQASAVAERHGKLLLVYFHEPEVTPNRSRFENETLAHAEVRQRLARCVCVKVPLDKAAAGKSTRQVDESGFEEMLGLPGLAVVDYAHREAAYYKQVVSVFPMIAGHWYTPERAVAILDLPAGTLTQRTMVYAVRVHPERPASTMGQFSAYLAQEAQQHSDYQASIHRQGHHFWETRFHRIGSQLSGGLMPSEVCAESWAGQRLLESAIECVRCWRLSSGHWRGVSSYHPVYAYDIKRGTNGIWYATGIFGGG
jgi:hypothetical protein